MAFAIKAEEAAEVEYLVDNSVENAEQLSATTKAVFDAIDKIAAEDEQQDRQLAADLIALHTQKRVAFEQLQIAVAAGDHEEARRIDLAVVDPIIGAIHDRLTEATDYHEQEAQSALSALRSTARWTLLLAPIVFAIGFGLMLLLWRILEGYHRATRKTYREIEQLSKLRSEFVSIVSHEFRTPLTGIQGFSELMRDEELTPLETREYAGDINKDARRLARLITDMLDLDRMESGQMTLNSEPVDLNRIVTDTAAQFRLSAAEHPIELELDPSLHDLLGDSDRLTQIVTNLVSNAIKYSPAGGTIELRTQREEGTVTLTVTDHGMGIPAAQLEKIFDRYSRVETTETRVIQGTGLGLPIVRQILQLCDGKVWATSEPGHGSVFHVQLPLMEAATPAPLAA
ncbi:MAG: ATP-binding protein [Chloroflexota bacterium]